LLAFGRAHLPIAVRPLDAVQPLRIAVRLLHAVEPLDIAAPLLALDAIHALDVGIAPTTAVRAIERGKGMALAASAAAGKRLALDGKAAAVAPAATARKGSKAAPAMYAAAPATGKGSSTAAVASATAVSLGLSLAAAVAATITSPGLCRCRDCDRQGGDACGEKQPGHRKSPFERGERSVRLTVPTLKRLEPAL
jgi:hypothetical protein